MGHHNRIIKSIKIGSVLFVGLFTLGNCGEPVGESFQIQTGCNQILNVTTKELNLITMNNHETTEHRDHPACPGFFAVIPEAKYSKSLQPECQSVQGLSTNPIQASYKIPEQESPLDKTIKSIITDISAKNIAASVSHLSKNFPTRFHKSQYGLQAAQWIKAQFEEIAGNRKDILVEFYQHNNTPQPSVVAKIRGVGELQEEEVILGGHEDSINGYKSRFFPDAEAPGADDNASGIATLLEVFRALVNSNFRPQKTISFYAYAAEEIGLVGSQEIAINYSRNNIKVVGVLQIDMDGFNGVNPDLKIGFMDDFTNPALTSHSKELVTTYLGLDVLSGSCGYGCSDHASWHKEGVPAIMPFEANFRESIKKIHKPTDTTARLNFEYSSKFAQFAVAFALTLSHDNTKRRN